MRLGARRAGVRGQGLGARGREAGNAEGFWHNLAQFGTVLACFPKKQQHVIGFDSIAGDSRRVQIGPGRTPHFRGGRGGARRTS